MEICVKIKICESGNESKKKLINLKMEKNTVIDFR